MKVRMMIGVMCAVALVQTGYPSVADAKGGHGSGHHGGGKGHDGGHHGGHDGGEHHGAANGHDHHDASAHHDHGVDMGQKVRAHGPGHGRGLGLGRGGGRRGGRAMKRHQRVLNKFDVNHDGVLDATESAQWQIVKERRRQQKQLMLQQGLPPGQTIAKQKKIK